MLVSEHAAPAVSSVWLRTEQGDLLRADQVVAVRCRHVPAMYPIQARESPGFYSPVPPRRGLLRRRRPARPERWEVVVDTPDRGDCCVVASSSRKWAETTRDRLAAALPPSPDTEGVLAYDALSDGFQLTPAATLTAQEA